MIFDSTEHHMLTANKPIDRSSVSLQLKVAFWFLIANQHSLLLSVGMNRLHIRRQSPQDQFRHQEMGRQRHHRAPQLMAYICTPSAKQSEVCLRAICAPIDHLEQAGSWALDPLAALLPTQNLVQMILDGKPSKKRFRTPKGVPPTATFSSRHGSVQAILRVVENASVRSTAKVYSKTRSGNITLDFVS